MTDNNKKASFPSPELVEKYTAELVNYHKAQPPLPPEKSAPKPLPTRHAIPPPAFTVPPVSRPVPPQTSVGTLRIEIAEKSTGIPVENAFVSVLADDGTQKTLLRFASTDKNGMTPLLSLPANPKGGGSRTYFIKISCDGYYPIEKPHVPVYAEILTLQPAELTLVVQPEEAPYA